MTRAIASLALAVLIASAELAAQKTAPSAATDNYDVLVARYLESARLTGSGTSADPAAWMSGLMGDLRAHQLNDLVTVRVEEVMTATGSADASVSKNGSASIGVPTLLGLETKLPNAVNPASLVSSNTKTDFKGAGTTTRAGTLSATLTARVSEVLPNGDIVIEGVREVEINGDRQIVVLTGVARVVDILPGNVLSSASIGQLRIRYFGRGLIKDSLSPGWLIRVLNKIF
jgi:flagellar L-ring protein precursor FlgH